MYDVTPAVRTHWHALMRTATHLAGIAIECVDHEAPASLPDLWGRNDLALAFMCGLPLATHYPDMRPLAAPVTVCSDDGNATYRSQWLVRAEAAFDTLASTFGHRIGWTAEHSHSGFNAPRHALLGYRSARRPLLFSESVGPLGHPRAALAALDAGRIDITAIDAYWWWLLQRHDADAASRFRAIGNTDAAPTPPLVCAPGLPRAAATRLLAALAALHADPGAQPHLAALGVRRFVAVTRPDYRPLADRDRAACAAGYPLPA
jgi:ABC-type phosphate/phosphonate transport system substrate-binding protein